ncbi:MAG: hypothetical protein V2J26_08405 [Pacificimonas sp.]|nr:hypothetical protein [Pacificimonas sp.]
MQSPQQRSKPPSSGMLVALVGGIAVTGAGFFYAYDTLRSDRITFSAPTFAAEGAGLDLSDTPRTRPPMSGALAEEAAQLRELGIDPETTTLSPQAQAAILRAHRAAQAAPATGDTMVEAETADGLSEELQAN